MAANPYAKEPLYAAQVDPESGRIVRAFFFLGSAPRAVLDAARRAKPRGAGGDPRAVQWAAADEARLRAHYGAHWRELLTATDPPAPEALAPGAAAARAAPTFFGNVTGGAGAELDFGDLGAIDEVGTEPAPAAGPPEPGAKRAEWALVAAGPPVYADQAAYPEDTLYDLRLKLGLASGVPLYRQHLFYYVNEEGPHYPYQLTVDGAPVAVDWRALAPPRWRGASGEAVAAGVAVDPRLEKRREGLRVEAHDTFRRLAPVPGVRVTRAYYVDLYAVRPPLGAAGEDDLGPVLRDRYQYDLLYYGGLLRYWPQLSPDAGSLALSEPGRVGAAYPALDPEPGPLRARFAAEKAVAEAALGWRPTAARGRPATAVTAATVRVRPEAARMRVAIRNVFDWLPTSPSLAAAVARFEVDTALLSEAGAVAAGPEARRGGAVAVLARKRHASSYGPLSAATVDWFWGRLPRRDTVALALARGAAADEGFVPRRAVPGARAQVPYAFLAVAADGHYEASADWREDDRVGFDAVARELGAVVAPVVAAINAMGAAAFPVGGRLAPAGALGPEGGRGATTLGALTVSAFWPHALAAAAFRALKDRFRLYEKAGVVGVRGLQQAGAYAFSFRKGVVAYDPRAADRAVGPVQPSARGPGALNQYAWLTDPAAAARWAAAFPGRLVRIHHRTTDLRVEVLGADSLAEFELIRRYVFSFLDGLLAGPDRLAADAAPAREPAEAAPASRRLRRLQERDPDLFDLKKYDPGATVYSVLCQSGRQPYLYDEREAAALPAKRRAALVRYWNFTEGAPAFYECPDPRFPHLSLRAGAHPLGYCLPCCKKARAAAGSRAALAHERCLRSPGAPEAAAEASLSRHVLTYGKAVPAGRVAEAPRDLREGLLLDAVPRPYGLYLVGVEQAAPAVPAAGYAYALAYALGIGEATADEVLAELAELAGAMGDTYYALGGGGGAAFASAADLADALLGAFVRRDPALSPLGPGGAAAAAWPAILADLARYAYGTEVVLADDPEGTGAVTLRASPEAAATIAGHGATPPCEPGAAPNAVPCGYVPPRIALLAAGPMGTYPVAALNPKLYLRAVPGGRWMAARRTFGFDDAALRASGEAGPETLVADRVAEVLRRALATASQGRTGLPDLALVGRWVRSVPAPGYAVELRLANLRDMCYGVVLRAADGSRAYLPVEYSAYPVNGTPVQYGPRPALALPKAALDAAVASLNAHIARAGEPYAPVAPAAVLVDAEGRAVGFAHVAAGPGALYFYHDPGPPPAGGPVLRLPYDPREVDAAVVAALRAPPAPPLEAEAAALAQAANARNRLYRLFLAELSAALRAERNDPLRGELTAALRATRFDVPASVAALRRRLAGLLREHPDDLQVVREAVGQAYADAPDDPGGAAAATIAATAFSFDRQALARMRALGSRPAVAAALRELLGPRIAITHAAPAALGNMYVSCREAGEGVPQGQCAGGRLQVPEDRIDAYYDIAAADVLNPGKTALLAAASAGAFDLLMFIRRPGEHLSVTLGP
jgi:hypothetical protein